VIPLTDNMSGLNFTELKVVWANCGGEDTFSVSGKKVNADTQQGLGGWTINLYGPEGPPGTFPFITSTVTAPDGTYSFPLPGPGTYKLCEVIADQPNWTQVLPAGPAVCNTANPPGEAANGHVFSTGDGGGQETPNCCEGEGTHTNIPDKDFANRERQPGPPECQKPTMYEGMNGAFPGNTGPDITVQAWAPLNESVQAAVDGVTDVNNDGYLIVLVIAKSDGSLGGTVPQNVVVSKDYGAKPFGLFGCSVTMTGGGSGSAVKIADTAKSGPAGWKVNGKLTTIFIMDLHGGNSGVGVEACGQYRYIRNTYGTNNGIGIKVVGNSNTVHNGKAEGNTGDGLVIQGNSNYVTDTDLFSNGGNGAKVTGNSNQLLKLDAGDKGKGNTGDGVNVTGSSNTLQEIAAYANGGDGIDVSGSGNTLTKNVAGDKGKGNGGDGIKVANGGNTLNENKANANTGNGFNIAGGNGTPNSLNKNVANSGSAGSATENGLAEFRLLNTVKNNNGGNKADNIEVPKTSAPTKCNAAGSQFPAKNATQTFAAAQVCE
jgi:hypothetical protein